ncbi:hypothetical protein Dda_9412 [Drechslerella dactyloides]|uniref:Glucose-methanol-choline oxidoreductase N-terminal domain-containing protein n=1 Tax=Drechslerella dactyloides TaxID=74499 RepID=A0AAD6NF62_DREDA|nr:hypothetical protein Dda_9412 [Drechslerella dactyloides]
MRRLSSILLQLALVASVAHSTPLHKRAELSGYEYVVVGSGGGGGPLAARLAILGHKVLLIEAGDDQGANINEQVPAFHAASTEDESMRWDYFVNHYSDPARQAKDTKAVYDLPTGGLYTGSRPPSGAGLKGILYPRAGTLGGCGSHNALITVYPHDSDWDYIRTITGDSSWSSSEMREYFVRLEKVNYSPNSLVGHGTDGWLWTERADLQLAIQDSKVISQLLAAASAMGQGLLGAILTVTNLVKVLLADANSGLPGRDSREGLFQIPLARRNKARNGPREFVLDTANAKNNDGSKKYRLDIRMNCLVTKIIWDTAGSEPKAVGVEFMDGKSLYRADPRSASAGSGTAGRVTVTREVILSAGAFNTPQLLKLSGIGPRSELESFEIPVISDLPGVGTNLQDRYEIGVVATTPTDFELLQGCTFNNGADPCLESWKAGDLSAYESNGFAQAIIKKTSQSSREDPPDIFMFAGPVGFRGYYPGYAADAVADHRHWTWVILKAHTGNTAGTVALRSRNPKDTPVINFNYFDTGTAGAWKRDLQAMIEAVALARKINNNLLLSEPFTEVSPGPSISSPSQTQEFIKNNAWGHHACCTAPIGADSDPNAVLDSKFRVRGVSGLRVVDASVFPKIPGLFIAVPIYMIAEKAADVIHAAAS